MNKQDEDKLLKIADKTLDTSLHISDNLIIQPNLPGTQVAVTLKPSKKTSLKVQFREDGASLTFTKKF